MLGKWEAGKFVRRHVPLFCHSVIHRSVLTCKQRYLRDTQSRLYHLDSTDYDTYPFGCQVTARFRCDLVRGSMTHKKMGLARFDVMCVGSAPSEEGGGDLAGDGINLRIVWMEQQSDRAYCISSVSDARKTPDIVKNATEKGSPQSLTLVSARVQ